MREQSRELQALAEHRTYADCTTRLGRGQFAAPIHRKRRKIDDVNRSEATLPRLGEPIAPFTAELVCPTISSVQHSMQRGIVFDYVLRGASSRELVELLRILQIRIDDVCDTAE